MNMKKLIVSAFICLFPVSVFAIAGFGLNVAYDQVIVNAGSDSRVHSPIVGPATEVRILRNGFENSAGVGGFLYLDVIPYIDIEVDFQGVGNIYQFDFQNYVDISLDDVPQTPEAKALDELNIKRYCCRRHMLTSVNLIDII